MRSKPYLTWQDLNVDQFKLDGAAYQAGGLIHVKLFHDVSTMTHRSFKRDPKYRSDLFGAVPVDNQLQNFALAFCETSVLGLYVRICDATIISPS